MKKLIIFILLLLPAMAMAFDMRSQGLTQSKIEATTFSNLETNEIKVSSISVSESAIINGVTPSYGGIKITTSVYFDKLSFLGHNTRGMPARIYGSALYTDTLNEIGASYITVATNLSPGGNRKSLGLVGSDLAHQWVLISVGTVTVSVGNNVLVIATNTRVDGGFYPKQVSALPETGYNAGAVLQLTTDDYMLYIATETVVGIHSWRKQ